MSTTGELDWGCTTIHCLFLEFSVYLRMSTANMEVGDLRKCLNSVPNKGHNLSPVNVPASKTSARRRNALI